MKDVIEEEIRRETEEIRARTEEIRARTERMILLNARKAYQSEIHAIALNVLVSVLTKDALSTMRDGSGFSAQPKLNIEELVDYSLIVGKKYVDELHKISVSDKQLAEYKDLLESQPVEREPLITPPPPSEP